MDIYMPEEQVEAWRKAAERVRETQRSISSAILALLPFAEPGTPAEAAVQWLTEVENTLNGAAYYRFAPQSEWMGGPPEVSITKHRWPHAVLDARNNRKES